MSRSTRLWTGAAIAVLAALLLPAGVGAAGTGEGGGGNGRGEASGKAAIGTTFGPGPRLDARSWALIDARSGKMLASSRPDRRLPMASTTKMMTALLALRELPAHKIVRAQPYDAGYGESLMGLEAGQRVSVTDLLHGLIMLSGNDAAYTLSIAAAGSERRFVRQMNATARRLGLDDTHYDNPIGLDGPSHYSSARDLTTLGRVLMHRPRFRRIAGARRFLLRSYRPPRRIETIDSFVADHGWAKGIKTGHTYKAKYLLVSDGRKRGTELIGAVMGADSDAERESETVRLLDYGFSRYRPHTPVRKGEAVVGAPISYGRGRLPLRAGRTVRVGLRQDQRLRMEIRAPHEVDGPVRKGRRLGTATVKVDGRTEAVVGLVAARDVDQATLAHKAGYYLSQPRVWMPLLGFAILVGVILAVRIRRRRQVELRRRMRRMRRHR